MLSASAVGNAGKKSGISLGPQIETGDEWRRRPWHENQLIPVTRHGKLAQVYWTYSYSPIDNEGKVGGVLVICRDVTKDYTASLALRAREIELARAFSKSAGSVGLKLICETVFAIADRRNISPFMASFLNLP